jgi:hypothetical protein
MGTTQARRRYLHETHKLADFVEFVRSLVSEKDAIVRRVQEPFLDELKEGDAELKSRLLRMVYDAERPLKQFSKYSRMLMQMIFARSVDNYLTYLAELLRMLARVSPEILAEQSSSKGQTSSRTSKIATDEIEQKVSSLASKGFKKLNDYFVKSVRLPLFENEQQFLEVKRIIEDRNVIVQPRHYKQALLT